MALPRASDVAVRVNLLLHSGERMNVVARAGQNLVDACQAGGLDVLGADDSGGGAITQVVHNETWTEEVFGEGPQSILSHVVLTEEWAAKVPPPMSGEARMLDEIDEDERKQNSRLASEITLTKALDGITCFVPPAAPFNIP
jgi:ferredoxin